MSWRSITLAACAAAVAGCMASGPKSDPAADKAALEKVRADYAAAFNSGDATKLGSLFASDGNSMNNAAPTAKGPQGVESLTKGMLAQAASQNVVINSEGLEISGDVAYDHGTYKTPVPPKAGPAMVEDGRFLVVLRRQADGSWKIVDAMGNTATPPAMPAAPAPNSKKK